MIPARYLDYTFGEQRIFYVTEGGVDLSSPPIVNCYFPDNDNKSTIDLKRLDIGVYYFEICFDRQGTHLFIFFEGVRKTGLLYALVKPY